MASGIRRKFFWHLYVAANLDFGLMTEREVCKAATRPCITSLMANEPEHFRSTRSPFKWLVKSLGL